MLKQISFKLTLLLFSTDIALTLLALYLAKILRLSLPYGAELQPDHLSFPGILYPIVAVIWMIVFLVIPVYQARRIYRAIDQLQVTTVAIAFSILLFAGVAYFFFRELSRFLFLYFFILDLGFLLGSRIILRTTLRLWQGGWPGRRTRLLLLGYGTVGERINSLLQDYTPYGVEIVGYLDDDASKKDDLLRKTPYLGPLNIVTEVVRQFQIDEVILALPSQAYQRQIEVIHQLQNLAVNVWTVPHLFELSFVKTSVEDFEGIPLVSLKTPAIDPFQQVIKRGFDLVVGGIAFICAIPIMALIALLIKIDSSGPVLYMPERVGQNGRIFRMFKFRSMVADAEHRRDEVVTYDEAGRPIHKCPNDPRVTKFGRYIRKTSLDELPQLINVIRGDMSLIGPRPEMPWLVEQYEPWQYQRFSVPQGMTGWWQVNGRSDKPMHLHVEEDMYYIQNYSLFLDIVILWKTLGAVVKRSGAF